MKWSVPLSPLTVSNGMAAGWQKKSKARIMPTLNLQVANDIASAILKFYARGKTIKQTMQRRPLLRFLNSGKKTFPGGNQYVSEPVQGAFMSDAGQPGAGVLGGGGSFFAGYQEDMQLYFSQ